VSLCQLQPAWPPSRTLPLLAPPRPLAATRLGSPPSKVMSRVFRTLIGAERRPTLGQAVVAPLICWSFSSSMFRYRLLDQSVPAMYGA
jgi:hypothetical protein